MHSTWSIRGCVPNSAGCPRTGVVLLLVYCLGTGQSAAWSEEVGRPELALQIGHSSNVLSVAYAPDGRLVASGSADQTIKLWDATSGQLIRTMVGHQHHVTAVAFSPDGRQLASSGSYLDRTIRLWDVQSGRQLREWVGDANDVRALAFSPDGALLASGGGELVVRLWDPSSGRLVKELQGHRLPVQSLTFAENGATLVSGGGGGRYSGHRKEGELGACPSNARFHLTWRLDCS